MRQIKFRAWDTEENKSISDFTNYAAWEAKLNGENAWRNPRYILEQFTGLKDKNGKEIYEGDVYAHDDGLVEVVWDNQSSCFECQFIKDRESSIPVFEIAFLSLIYCGNIHEGETK